MSPCLSIIIPLYNNAHLLTRCVESLIAQDFRKDQLFEIIIINDGSTDNAIEVVDSLQRKYDMIRLINQENKGVSAARNRGIDEAKGKYIYFIDPDDALVGGYFSQFLEILQKTKCPLFRFDYIEVDDLHMEAELLKHHQHLNPIDYRICTINQMGLHQHLAFTNYIYEREYLIDSQCRFRTDLMIAEDLIWLNRVLSYKKVPIVFTNEVVYLYYQNPYSVMHANDRPRLYKLANQYCNVIYAYIDLLKTPNLDSVITRYVQKIELKLYAEKYIQSLYSGIVKINRANILFLKENHLYPIRYNNYSLKDRVYLLIVNNYYLLKIVNILRRVFVRNKKFKQQITVNQYVDK